MARKYPGVRGVSAKQVRELCKLPWVRDDALSSRLSEARVLPDGRVLLFIAEGERGTLFPSRETLAEVRRVGEELAAKGPVDLTRTLLPPIADFLRDVKAHAGALAARLGLPDEALDRSLDSLNAVDKKVWRIARAKRTTPELVTPLTAYIGEVMLPICGGRWTKPPPKPNQAGETHIVIPDSVTIIIDTAELPAWQAAWRDGEAAIKAAADKAAAEAAAQGASSAQVHAARGAALRDAWQEHAARVPAPVQQQEVAEPASEPSNEPMIRAHNGCLVQPFAIVVHELEHGGRGSLRGAVGGSLAAHRLDPSALV